MMCKETYEESLNGIQGYIVYDMGNQITLEDLYDD